MEAEEIKSVFIKAVKRRTDDRVVNIQAKHWKAVGGKLDATVERKLSEIEADPIGYAESIDLLDADEDNSNVNENHLKGYLLEKTLVSVTAADIRKVCGSVATPSPSPSPAAPAK